MPYKSAKQRRYMHANHPEIAERWDRKYGGKVAKGKKGTKKKSTKKSTTKRKSGY